MFRKPIEYTDYNGVRRKETFDFYINKAELAELNLKYKGGLKEMLEYMVKAEDSAGLVKFIRELILMSYGVKEPGGKRFIKSKEQSDAFAQTEAYSELFMSLLSSAEATAEFVKQILPADLNPDTAVNDTNINSDTATDRPALTVVNPGN